MSKKQALFLSFDIEADGICAGLNSMLSFGVAGFTIDDGLVFEYEANLFPLPNCQPSEKTMEWWNEPAQKEAYNYATSNQRPADEVFKEFNIKIIALQKQYNIFPVAWPINYDWSWLNYYFCRFVGSNPFGHRGRCIASYAWALSKNLTPSDHIDCEQWIDPLYNQHTHKALDDAKEQGGMMMNMIKCNHGK